ncbi:MAG: bleomycin resistance protein [Deltaproteobacteria bacterium]|nr:MAG: bleomycin resistance protein [Deltaproteobacteria bacterium]
MADPCGCPPTDADAATGVHHVIVNVNELARSREFYAWLLPKLGYPGCTDAGSVVGWYGPAGSFWIKQAGARFAADVFHKDRVGLCEIAFAATSRAQVDALARQLDAAGVTILDPPQEYAYTPGYYAVFFADPDGMKLELVHIPSAGR